MTIRTVTASGVTAVNFNPSGTLPYFYASEKYAWIKNPNDAPVYASLNSSCTAGADGTMQIGAGECGRIELSPDNMIYLNGTGSVEIRTTDVAESPFKVQGRGGDKLVRYLGITTTPLYDGATVNPILIDGSSVTAKEADWAVYASADFLFNGTVWQKGGDFENYYTKTETDTLLSAKANSADVFTKTQSDDKYIAKSNIDDEPTTAEINASISNIWG